MARPWTWRPNAACRPSRRPTGRVTPPGTASCATWWPNCSHVRPLPWPPRWRTWPPPTPLYLERQADALLNGLMTGVDLAAAPLVAAALQVTWTHLLLEVQRQHARLGQPFGRLDDETICPCCGSRPTASIVRSAGDTPGQRYLHCSLCNLQWHMVRIKCSHCLSTKGLAYQALDTLDGDADPADDAQDGAAARAAKAAVQAETCDECDHYLKIVHADRDPFVDPVADDLASLTLDLLVSETGLARHGINLMLLFGEPEAPPDAPPGAPRLPGGA